MVPPANKGSAVVPVNGNPGAVGAIRELAKRTARGNFTGRIPKAFRSYWRFPIGRPHLLINIQRHHWFTSVLTTVLRKLVNTGSAERDHEEVRVCGRDMSFR